LLVGVGVGVAAVSDGRELKRTTDGYLSFFLLMREDPSDVLAVNN
jgi:hypothetical protein